MPAPAWGILPLLPDDGPILLDGLRRHLLDQGAVLVAAADVTALPEAARSSLPTAVAVALALDPAVISGIAAGPTEAYCREYERANAELVRLAGAGADWLRDRGFAAEDVPPTTEDFDRQRLRVRLQHKTVARLAGLGWIGRCALLITPQFGSAVRFSSVLTDAPLPVGRPVDAGRCGTCDLCVRVCPGAAPSGRSWQVGLQREDFFDAHACLRAILRFGRRRGIPRPICGMCIAACPWTQRYLSPEGSTLDGG